jgi:hypothetical protein
MGRLTHSSSLEMALNARLVPEATLIIIAMRQVVAKAGEKTFHVFILAIQCDLKRCFD